MLVEIPVERDYISIVPENEFEEIAQNVQMIITTLKGQVPMDRDFGINAVLADMPINIAQTRIAAEIVTAVNDFEPRVKVRKVNFSGDKIDGVVVSSVTVEIVERRLRGGLS